MRLQGFWGPGLLKLSLEASKRDQLDVKVAVDDGLFMSRP